MKKLSILHFIAVCLVFFSCEEATEECDPTFDPYTCLLGKWQVYERGYSPGAGYVIEAVPNVPAQIMNFETGNEFSSNIEGLEEYTYYLILDDPASENDILALYKDPSNISMDINNLEHSYTIRYENRNLRLGYRYCIEGCHIGLKKLN